MKKSHSAHPRNAHDAVWNFPTVIRALNDRNLSTGRFLPYEGDAVKNFGINKKKKSFYIHANYVVPSWQTFLSALRRWWTVKARGWYFAAVETSSRTHFVSQCPFITCQWNAVYLVHEIAWLVIRSSATGIGNFCGSSGLLGIGVIRWT